MQQPTGNVLMQTEPCICLGFSGKDAEGSEITALCLPPVRMQGANGMQIDYSQW
jgi:hypothetical protein